jgi:hypothetical protein
VLDERAAGGLVLCLGREEGVALDSRAARTAEEDTFAHVCARQGGRVLRGQLATERQESARVILVVVAEDHVGHVREVEVQLARVGEDRLGPGPRVEEQPVAVHFHQGCEAPFADSFLGEHGGEDEDAEATDAGPRRSLAALGPGAHGNRGQRHRQGQEGRSISHERPHCSQ